MSPAEYAARIASTPTPQTSHLWATGVSNLFTRSHGANVVWQDTSSNATYCSASAALGGIA